jgi:pilus assembly protein Flp/PilA
MKLFPRFIATHVTRFVKDDNGADLVEYALIIGLVSLAAITTLASVNTGIGALFSDLSAQLSTALD